MKELGHLKTYKMKLTTLSPVFIGGGEFSDLSNLQYVLTKNELKIIDETKFMKFLKETNYLDNFIKYVSTPQYNERGKQIASNLSNWINKNFGNRELDIYSRTEQINVLANRGLNCIKSFIKDENGNPYIPGTSIKGAIRTALLADLINSGLNKHDADEELKKEMAYIQVSDTKPYPSKSLMYRQTQHQQLISDPNSEKKNGYLKVDKKLMNVDNNLKEILKEGVVLRFNITIENKSRYDIEQILAILDMFYSDVYNENKELNLIAKNLKTNINVPDCMPNINIGGQSGFNTKVVLKIMSKDFAEYMQRKKEQLNKSFRKHSHLQYKIAPRCLRVVERFKENDNTLISLGWCNISLAE